MLAEAELELVQTMESIVIRGAREHNLKNIDVVVPRNKFVVITGVSGSGKSSLAFDTIFAEGQRRYCGVACPRMSALVPWSDGQAGLRDYIQGVFRRRFQSTRRSTSSAIRGQRLAR